MKTVKDFNGKDLDIKLMQECLRINYPSFCRKDIDDEGTPFLTNCTVREHEDFEIVGNGTLQFPLMICKKIKNKHMATSNDLDDDIIMNTPVLTLNDFGDWYEKWYGMNPMKEAFLNGLKELAKNKK